MGENHSGWKRGGCGGWVETLMVRHVEFEPSSGMQKITKLNSVFTVGVAGRTYMLKDGVGLVLGSL